MSPKGNFAISQNRDEFVLLNPKDVMVEDWVRRKYADEDFLERLKEDVEIRGLQEEPTVELIDGKYYLRSGYQRYLVYLTLKKPMRCRVKSFKSDYERWEFHIKENTMRLEICDLEKGKEAIYAVDVLKRSKDVVAKALGVTKNVLDKLILIERGLPEDVKRILRHRKYTQIYELLRLKDNVEALRRLAEWIADEDPSPGEIRAAVDRVLGVRREKIEFARGGKYAPCFLCKNDVEKATAERLYLHTDCYERLKEKLEGVGGR